MTLNKLAVLNNYTIFGGKFSGSTYGKTSTERLDESNKGHQMLKKMGWGGAGLGAKEQGIEQPISGGEVCVIPVLPVLQFYFLVCIPNYKQYLVLTISLISDS